MASKKRDLGLEKIFGPSVLETIDEIQKDSKLAKDISQEIQINLIKVNKDQPRKQFSEENINELADSIDSVGLIQPIIINKDFIIIAGERRYRAFKKLGRKTIPAIILDISDEVAQQYSIIENVQRVDLSPIEEAYAYQKLINDYKYKQEDLAKKVGKSRPHIANIIRLLDLPDYIKEGLSNNLITMGHAKPLLSILSHPNQIKFIYNKIINSSISVREVESLVAKVKKQKLDIDKKIEFKSADLLSIEDKMTKKLKTSVKIDKNRITVKYNGSEELNRILEILKII